MRLQDLKDDIERWDTALVDGNEAYPDVAVQVARRVAGLCSLDGDQKPWTHERGTMSSMIYRSDLDDYLFGEDS